MKVEDIYGDGRGDVERLIVKRGRGRLKEKKVQQMVENGA